MSHARSIAGSFILLIVLLAMLVSAGTGTAQEDGGTPVVEEPTATTVIATEPAPETPTETIAPTEPATATSAPTSAPTAPAASSPVPTATVPAAASPTRGAGAQAVIVRDNTYEAVGNTQLRVAAPASAPSSLGRVARSTNPLANDETTSGGTLSVTSGTVTGDQGGVAVFRSNGKFHYQPPTGFTGTERIEYRVTNGTTSATGVITITVSQRVWYVKNDADAGGDGSSTRPFRFLAEAVIAASAGDTIYVHQGDGTTDGLDTGITLKNKQRLIGSASQLKVGDAVLANAIADGFPYLSNPGGAAVVVAASTARRDGVVISGIRAEGLGSAIRVASSGTRGFGVTVSNVRLSSDDACLIGLHQGSGSSQLTVGTALCDAGNTGFDVQATTPGLTVALSGLTVGVATPDFGPPEIGVRIRGAAGAGTSTRIPVAVTEFSGITVSGDVTGDGVFGEFVDFATSGGASGLAIGSDGNPVGGVALHIVESTGSLAFGVSSLFGQIAIQAFGSADPSLAKLNLVGGTAVWTASSAAGPAMDLSGVRVQVRATLLSTGSPSNALRLSNIDGSLVGTVSSRLEEATGETLWMNRGALEFTYRGSITDDTGKLISITETTGTIAFEGAISDGNDGDGEGIALDGNTGSIRFSGGLVLSTLGATPFSATNGGKIAVTGAANTIVARDAPAALYIAKTAIAAEHLTFRSISIPDASAATAYGIYLQNTGTEGRLKVTGDGTSRSGGVLVGCHTPAASGCVGGPESLRAPVGVIVLGPNSGFVLGPELNDMAIRESLYGDRSPITLFRVNGATLNRLSIRNARIAQNDDFPPDSAVFVYGTGVVTITDCTLYSYGFTGINVLASETSQLTANITRCSFGRDSALAEYGYFGRQGVVAESTGASSLTISVKQCQFATLSSGGEIVSFTAKDASAMKATAETNTFTNFTGTAISATTTSTVRMLSTIRFNTITKAAGQVKAGSGIAVTSSTFGVMRAYVGMNAIANTYNSPAITASHAFGLEGSMMEVTIFANSIGTDEANSGGARSPGIVLQHIKNGRLVANISTNTIKHSDGFGIHVNVVQSSLVAVAPSRADITMRYNAIRNLENDAAVSGATGIFVDTNRSGTDYTLCLDMKDNDSTNASPSTVTLRVRKGTSLIFRLEGYSPDATGSSASVENYLEARNPGEVATVGGSLFKGVFTRTGAPGTCPEPMLP